MVIHDKSHLFLLHLPARHRACKVITRPQRCPHRTSLRRAQPVIELPGCIQRGHVSKRWHLRWRAAETKDGDKKPGRRSRGSFESVSQYCAYQAIPTAVTQVDILAPIIGTLLFLHAVIVLCAHTWLVGPLQTRACLDSSLLVQTPPALSYVFSRRPAAFALG
jgi:hypothetical protein